MILANGTDRFSCRRQKSSRTESWEVALPNLVTKWPSLNCDNILQPTWNVSSFLRPSTVDPTAASSISASHVSARNLKDPCPLSLIKALHKDFVDRSTCHGSYMEEKDGLIANDTYVEISHPMKCLP